MHVVEVGADGVGALALETLEQEAELGDLDCLAVDVHAVDMVKEDSLAFGDCESEVVLAGLP